MIAKIYRLTKEIAIAVLLVLSLWLVVNGAFKESKDHFEFGNLMDFFNTLGTLGTLYVAYLVYKNAPKWLHQKIDEQGLEIANKLFTENILELHTRFITLHSCLKIFLHNNERLNSTIAYNNLKLDLGSSKIDIITLQNIRYQTSANYVSLKKLGWVFHDDVMLSFDTLLNKIDLYIAILKSINRRMNTYNGALSQAAEVEKERNERRLLSIIKFVQKYEVPNFDRYHKSHNNFIDIAATVPDYFKTIRK